MAPTTVSAPAQEKDHSFVLLFVALMLVMFLASLSQMVLSSALPTIVGELNGIEHLAWVSAAYLLASTIMMPIYGKLSDVFGRKPLIVIAVVLFLIGSVVGGLAGDMNWLIAGRAIQGLGGGGLMILSQASIADVVPARERGKYMGLLGAVFAVSSVAGPLLGGWFTDGPGWRWAFWMNIPIGILALIAVVAYLRIPVKAVDRGRTDVFGMILMAAATTGIVLVATWGGSTLAWNSPEILWLIAGSVVSLVLFLVVESKADEPIIPMTLFKDLNFNLSTIASLLTAVAMFGAIGYMPLYFQMALGESAINAGLLMIPMMATLLITSVGTGILVSKTGKYKSLPIYGTLVLAVGLGLLGTVTLSTSLVVICVYMALVGVGLGGSMQILTLIVQNSFPNNMVGTATASNNYFRQIGGTIGTAVVGSLFVSRLATLLAERLPAPAKGEASPSFNSLTPEIIQNLPDAVRLPVIGAFNDALMPLFTWMLPLALVSVAVLLFVKAKPLSTTVEGDIMIEAIAEGQLIMNDDDEPGRVNRPF
jgi:EmrB/QacA subfamily drug resistance transporter